MSCRDLLIFNLRLVSIAHFAMLSSFKGTGERREAGTRILMKILRGHRMQIRHYDIVRGGTNTRTQHNTSAYMGQGRGQITKAGNMCFFKNKVVYLMRNYENVEMFYFQKLVVIFAFSEHHVEHIV